MDNVKQLLIRACKSAEPQKRVRRVYRRFYLSSGDDAYINTALCGILAGIVDKYCPMTSCEFINQMSPDRDWMHPEGDYHGRALSVLISKIRLTDASSFQGLRPPSMFRKAA
jgi:hypothetical protein